MIVRTATSRSLAAALLIAAGAAAGCHTWWVPGGPMGSDDRYSYVSTEWMPQTVTVVDTVSQQAIWSKEVPVGQKLIMRFTDPEDLKDGEAPDPRYPVRLDWDLWPSDQEWGSPRQVSWVVKSRRVDIKLRPTPEKAPPPPEPTGPPPGTPTNEKPPVQGR